MQILNNTDYTVLILANSMFFPHGQVTEIMPRKPTLLCNPFRDDTLGNPPQNTHS